MSALEADWNDDEIERSPLRGASPSASASRLRFSSALSESARPERRAVEDAPHSGGASGTAARRSASTTDQAADASASGSIVRLIAFVVIAAIAMRLILMDAYYTVAGWAFVGIVPATWDDSTVRVGGSLLVLNAWMTTQALFLAVQTGFFPVALRRGKFVIVGDRFSIAAWSVLTLLNALSTIVGLYVDLPSWSLFGSMVASNAVLHIVFAVIAGIFVSVASERIFIASLSHIRSEATLLRKRQWRK